MGEEEQQQTLQQQQKNSDIEVTEATHENQQEYTWPLIRFDVPPHRTYHFYNQFRTSSIPNNFLKGIKWYMFLVFLIAFFNLYLLLTVLNEFIYLFTCLFFGRSPDGSSFLTSSEDNTLRIFSL